jgi:ribosomal protein L28
VYKILVRRPEEKTRRRWKVNIKESPEPVPKTGEAYHTSLCTVVTIQPSVSRSAKKNN